MKRLFDYINSKVLVNVAGLNSANLITKIVAGLLTTKFIAVFIGAEGLALIGNIKNFLTAYSIFCNSRTLQRHRKVYRRI